MQFLNKIKDIFYIARSKSPITNGDTGGNKPDGRGADGTGGPGGPNRQISPSSSEAGLRNLTEEEIKVLYGIYKYFIAQFINNYVDMKWRI